MNWKRKQANLQIVEHLRKEFVKRGMPQLQSFGVEQDWPKENDGVVNTK